MHRLLYTLADGSRYLDLLVRTYMTDSDTVEPEEIDLKRSRIPI